MKQFTTYLIIFLVLQNPVLSHAALSPAAVGWGNLIVPGLGATIRGESTRGLIEATTELGLFFGGTFGAREGAFTIDSTIVLQPDKPIYRPVLGSILQQFGLKLHMYNTFYNYQQAALAVETSDREKNNPQPLYRGTAWDVIEAPFEWKNLSSPWVFPVILASAAYLFYDYHTAAVQRRNYPVTTAENTLYALSSIPIVPMGSAYGEEPVFRGFMQRELRSYTDSLILSIVTQAVVFAAIHPSNLRVPALAAGLYFGFLTDHFHGDLGPAITTHLWVDVISGVFNYLVFYRSQGKNTPFAPPINVSIQVPL